MMQHQLILYGKAGCHLCEIAEQMLLGLRREFDFAIQKVDITGNPTLVAIYGTRIPVIVINNQRVLQAPIRLQTLRDALMGERL